MLANSRKQGLGRPRRAPTSGPGGIARVRFCYGYTSLGHSQTRLLTCDLTRPKLSQCVKI
eukprot:6857798-Prymnesium_polylepis.1